MLNRIRELKSHQGFMRYFRNTSWLFVEKILRIFVSLFVGIWVARYLGPEQYGLFSYVQSFVGLFSIIAGLGLNGIIVRELLNNKDEKNQDELIGTAFCLKVIGAIVVLIILAFAINFTTNDNFTNILVFIIASATIFQSFNVIDFYFQSKVLSKYVVYSNILTLFLSSILKIILILNDAPLIAFAWVVLFDSFILSCGFIYFYFKHNTKLNVHKLRFSSKKALSLLKDGWPLILSGVVVSVYMKIDQVMIKEIIDAEAVGLYAVAVRLSELWYFIPAAIVSSIFPAIVNAKKHSEELYYSRLQRLYDLMVWLAIFVAIPLSFFGDIVVELLFGVDYYGAGSVLVIHIWSGVFVFLGLAFGRYLLTENLNKKTLYRTSFGAILNVLLNYFLIPAYGIQGAAVATLVAQIAANYIYDFFDKDLHSQAKMKTMAFFPLHIFRGYK